MQNFCDEPDVRKLFPMKINYEYVLRCKGQIQMPMWELCYDDNCVQKYECLLEFDRKFRWDVLYYNC